VLREALREAARCFSLPPSRRWVPFSLLIHPNDTTHERVGMASGRAEPLRAMVCGLERESYEAQNRAYFDQYLAGTLDIHEYLGFALRPLAQHSPADLARWHEDFMASRILPMVRDPARALVRRHLARGDLCAVITATNSFVTAPIAREFGVHHLIATEPEKRGGRFTGRVAGTPCFREGKVRRLDEWLAAQGHALGGFEESAFYSDSHNDLPLLERVSRPVAVDPDEALRKRARERGWEVISLHG
jgi:HAD superfamily hydrolase (TIGR01490 family)